MSSASGKRVVVTGGCGKLGRAVVTDLVEHGWDVVVFDRTAPTDGTVTFVPVDLTDYAAVLDAMLGVEERYDAVDAEAIGSCYPQRTEFLSSARDRSEYDEIAEMFGDLYPDVSVPQNAGRWISSVQHHMAKAGEHLQYMSTECANLAEGLRTGPARGLRGSALSELSENYRKQCGEDEQQAHQRLWQQQADEKMQRKQEDQARGNERKRAVIASEQCNEMLGALHKRRQRAATMTAGEKADLDLFEANYKARCTSG